MLVQFTLKNYKLFLKESLLDFLPAPIHDHSSSLLKDPTDGEAFLPILAVYGPNGCGKSSLLYALRQLASFVTEGPAFKETLTADILPCLYDPDAEKLPTEFNLLFRQDGFLFCYQFALNKKAILHENLFCGRPGTDAASILFERRETSLHLGKNIHFPEGQISPLAPLLPRLTGSRELSAALGWFKALLFFSENTCPELPGLPMDFQGKEALLRLLTKLDMDICDYRLHYPAGQDTPQLLLTHKTSLGQSISLPLSHESEGTRKLLSLLPDLIKSLSTGSLLLADDLDSLLHPQLLKAIAGLYTNPDINRCGAQLLFTSHNTAILTPSLLRRDEIWLCCRPEDQDAILYPLTSYKKENGLIPRNDEAYGKQYLEGRYGAVPHIHFS